MMYSGDDHFSDDITSPLEQSVRPLKYTVKAGDSQTRYRSFQSAYAAVGRVQKRTARGVEIILLEDDRVMDVFQGLK